VAIYLTRIMKSDGFIDICKDYNLKKYSSTSSFVDSDKERLSKEQKFCNRVKSLNEKLIKGQSET